MFALALWDQQLEELWMARDLFSVKPLHLLRLGRATPLRPLAGELLEASGPLLRSEGRRKFASVIKYSGELESAYLLRRCLHLRWELNELVDPRVRTEGLAKGRAGCRSIDVHRRAGLQAARWRLLVICAINHCATQIGRAWLTGLEVRVPFLNLPLLKRFAPTLASERPITKIDVARCVGPV